VQKDREISPEFLDLAKRLLSNNTIDEILELSERYFVKSQQMKVKRRLHELLKKQTPNNSMNAKPLLNYAAIDLFHLDSRSRTVVETASASIDYLCGFLLQEHGIDRNNTPMGGVITKLESDNILEPELIESLQIFNRIVYVPAKHHFPDLPDKSHLFSVPDSICILFVVSSLTRTLSSMFTEKHESWHNSEFVGKKL